MLLVLLTLCLVLQPDGSDIKAQYEELKRRVIVLQSELENCKSERDFTLRDAAARQLELEVCTAVTFVCCFSQ